LSLTLKEGHRLRVFENSALRGKFEAKRDEVTKAFLLLIPKYY
jgi:hypothetical protein